ncbi:T9SS type A sorting domain-containing protein [Flavihumibacter sp.]|uniref:T9SS type A sorting domain-containing protein n=1 Tax=Flavihumibacter sp. TaxID=1913981 RepID=UPI002FCC77C8
MKKRSSSFILLLQLLSITIMAQSVSIRTLNSGGGTLASGNLLVETTLGELVGSSFSNSTHLVTQGFLQPYRIAIPPTSTYISKIQFAAKRVNASQVKLDWKTDKELNSVGFHIERKLADGVFTKVGYMASAAPGGNSNLPLSYTSLDANAYPGKSYYQLKQEYKDGSFSYSVVRAINGSKIKQTILSAWPVPSNGDLRIMAEGITQDMLEVYSFSGALVKKYSITEFQVVKITGLAPGAYVVRLMKEPDVMQKIIVQ